ncbi:alpha/beta hydrolase [Gordonia sp. HY285]|uniref:alpha/beta hydrolase n=1 Tax=Gordonia liuliyuniae TaxID=2911517 RepID=UPI001F2FCC8D|nr:alpha/beta hydrolase [Gordonia liuliyuniae]MCF8611156.1 alpha/beta hydrolase [Gordonia liuliyuniae]
MPNQITTTDYDARATVTEAQFDAIMARYLAQSADAVRDLHGAPGVVYDATSRQRLDVWGTGSTPRPAFFVVHGGYWRALSRHHTLFMADVLAEAGIATVAIDYGLAPATPLREIVRQTRAAYAHVLRHGADYGLDVDRVVVGGSSAGAHLAAMTMVGGGWTDSLGIGGRTARAGLLISGLYDLRPLVDTPANDWLSLTEQSATALSPAFAPDPPPGTTAFIADAEIEAAGFARQSSDLRTRWSDSVTIGGTTVTGRNHFDVFLDLADPASELTAAVIDLVDAAGVHEDM